MNCKNLRCIYNQDSACKADEIHLDQYGKCADCVYPEQNQQNTTESTTHKPIYAMPSPRLSPPFSYPPDKEEDPELQRILKKYKKVKK